MRWDEMIYPRSRDLVELRWGTVDDVVVVVVGPVRRFAGVPRVLNNALSLRSGRFWIGSCGSSCCGSLQIRRGSKLNFTAHTGSCLSIVTVEIPVEAVPGSIMDRWSGVACTPGQRWCRSRWMKPEACRNPDRVGIVSIDGNGIAVLNVINTMSPGAFQMLILYRMLV